MGTINSTCDVVVIGAGLAGLACARQMTRSGLDAQVVEASDAVGGRVRTDRVDGFLLDRGFQVLNTAYPELARQADLDQLELCFFSRAMLLHVDGQTVRLADPRRHPRGLVAAARSPIGGVRDKAALAAYLGAVAALPAAVLRRRPERTARERWHSFGMSETIIDRCLQPFFAGLLLEPDMSTSSRFTDLMMQMFVRGRSAVPAAGMQALPEQLAEGLTVHLQQPVTAVKPTEVLTRSGPVRAKAVVLATAADAAARLLPGLRQPAWKGVTTMYHATAEAPLDEPTLVVDAEPSPVNNTVVITAAAPSYAPKGRALIATSIVHDPRSGAPEADEALIRSHLARLYQTSTTSWEHVATYAVPQALPSMTAPHPFQRPVRVGGVYVCGDHRDTSSIQGALVSGRRAADAVALDLGAR